jgi:hypothetical protein
MLPIEDMRVIRTAAAHPESEVEIYRQRDLGDRLVALGYLTFKRAVMDGRTCATTRTFVLTGAGRTLAAAAQSDGETD